MLTKPPRKPLAGSQMLSGVYVLGWFVSPDTELLLILWQFTMTSLCSILHSAPWAPLSVWHLQDILAA